MVWIYSSPLPDSSPANVIDLPLEAVTEFDIRRAQRRLARAFLNLKKKSQVLNQILSETAFK